MWLTASHVLVDTVVCQLRRHDHPAAVVHEDIELTRLFLYRFGDLFGLRQVI